MNQDCPSASQDKEVLAFCAVRYISGKGVTGWYTILHVGCNSRLSVTTPSDKSPG